MYQTTNIAPTASIDPKLTDQRGHEATPTTGAGTNRGFGSHAYAAQRQVPQQQAPQQQYEQTPQQQYGVQQQTPQQQYGIQQQTPQQQYEQTPQQQYEQTPQQQYGIQQQTPQQQYAIQQGVARQAPSQPGDAHAVRASDQQRGGQGDGQQYGTDAATQSVGAQGGAATSYLATQPVQQGLTQQPIHQALTQQPIQQGLPRQPIQQGFTEFPQQPVQRGLGQQPAMGAQGQWHAAGSVTPMDAPMAGGLVDEQSVGASRQAALDAFQGRLPGMASASGRELGSSAQAVAPPAQGLAQAPFSQGIELTPSPSGFAADASSASKIPLQAGAGDLSVQTLDWSSSPTQQGYAGARDVPVGASGQAPIQRGVQGAGTVRTPRLDEPVTLQDGTVTTVGSLLSQASRPQSTQEQEAMLASQQSAAQGQQSPMVGSPAGDVATAGAGDPHSGVQGARYGELPVAY